MKKFFETLAIIFFVLFISLTEENSLLVQAGFFVAACAILALVAMFIKKD